MAAAEGDIRDGAGSDGDRVRRQCPAGGRAVAVEVVVLAARGARLEGQVIAEGGRAAHGFVGFRFGWVEFGAAGGVADFAGEALDPVQVAAGVHDGGGFLRRSPEGYVHDVFSVSGCHRSGE